MARTFASAVVLLVALSAAIACVEPPGPRDGPEGELPDPPDAAALPDGGPPVVHHGGVEAPDAGEEPDGGEWIVDDDGGWPERVAVFPVAEAAISGPFDGKYRVRDTPALFRPFFEAGRSGYSHVVAFTDFALVEESPPAWAFPVDSDIAGVGFDKFPFYPWDFTSQFGDLSLRVAIIMNDVSSWPEDPEEAKLGPYSSLDVLQQEFGHMSAMYAAVLIDGVPDDRLLDRSGAHWAWNVSSGPTPLMGNTIQDNGDGTFTTLPLERPLRYNPWDLYLMGLAAADGVPDIWLVDSACCFVPRGVNTDRPYATPNVTFRGTRRDVALEALIAAEGPRVPAYADSPKEFKLGFLLLGLPDRPARAASARKVDAVRRAFEEKFPDLVSGRATLDTSL